MQCNVNCRGQKVEPGSPSGAGKVKSWQRSSTDAFTTITAVPLKPIKDEALLRGGNVNIYSSQALVTSVNSGLWNINNNKKNN